jgi:hypothetical protein
MIQCSRRALSDQGLETYLPPKQQSQQGGNEPPMDFDDDIPF